MKNGRVSARFNVSEHVDSEQLVLRHRALVRAMATTVRAKLPRHIEVNDLVQDGMLGLVDAARRYDPHRGVKFSDYAKHRIRGAILDGLRRMDPASRHFRSTSRRVAEAVRELGNELGRNPTEAEVAARVGFDMRQWRNCAGVRESETVRQRDGGDGGGPSELTADESSETEAMAVHAELRTELFAALHMLPSRSREIIRLYHWRGLAMREIGQIFGITEGRVSQIHRRALEMMSARLRSSGITSCASVLLR